MARAEKQYIEYLSHNGLEIGNESLLSFLQSLTQKGNLAASTLRGKISTLRAFFREQKITLDEVEIRRIQREHQQKLEENRLQQDIEESEPALPETNVGPRLATYVDMAQVQSIAAKLSGPHRLAFLATIFTASTISTLQNVFFSNLSCYELDDVGGVRIELNLTKNSANEPKDYIHFIRNKDPELCVVGELARNMVNQFKYRIPNTSEKPLEVDEKIHRRLLRNIHKELCINLVLEEHACRLFATNYMRYKGVPESEIQQHSRCRGDEVNANYYGPDPPEAAIKTLAAVESVMDLPRSLVDPPFELIKKLCFRWLETDDHFYRVIGTVYLQDATIIPIPELEEDEEFQQFKNQSLSCQNRVKKAEERRRQEKLEESTEKERCRRKKPKVSSYDPENGVYMERYLSTVREIAEEYLFGIDNRESIQQLDRTRGSSWRRVSKERSFYCNRRKPIYILIEKLLQEYNQDKEAVLKRVVQDTKNVTVDEFLNSLFDGSYYRIHNME
ncbi:hypothetical protein GAYE_SCF31G4891 [Galdieria yellowstonensis]|uniref:Core-binding (CB) domain-containing protein n=1 Tax=Galdieria yellowstonensis TaxID=3028027 RepID=A0AAV9IHY1_9RHOD|nr:hypothetical protein GAYE_SCF31G4891 [Galdieria yellowstonensis]